MGAQQTFQWAVSFPEVVPRILPFCGSARTSKHNYVFLEGVKAVITADAAWRHGDYDEQPEKGLRSMAGSTPAGASPRPSARSMPTGGA